MKGRAGTYVLDQKRGITLMMFTKITALEEGDVTVMEVVPILNVNLSRVDDAKKGIVFMEDDIEQSEVLYECTTFDVQWSEAEEVFEIAGFNGKKECLYRCRVKPELTKRHGEKPKPKRPTKIDEV